MLLYLLVSHSGLLHLPCKQDWSKARIGGSNPSTSLKFPKGKIIENSKFIKKNKKARERYEKRKQEKCLNCGNKSSNLYCSHTCQHEYNKNKIFRLLEEDELELSSLTHSRWAKKYLIEKYGEECMKCGWSEKHLTTGKVPIELNHIDGNSENNKLDNLELLCPNCHSLTYNYKALNAGNGRSKRRERYRNGLSY